MNKESIGEKLFDDWTNTLTEDEYEAVDLYLGGFVALGFNAAREKINHGEHLVNKYYTVDEFYNSFKNKGEQK